MSFFQNTCKPSGLGGRLMVKMMNSGHAKLADWGFSQIQAKADARVLDAGCGGGVIDRVRQLGFCVTEVPFGSAPVKAGQYANKRAEMWGEMAAWLKAGGALPPGGELRADLCASVYDFDVAGRLRLEPKEKIKERTGRSPDLGDALALTFAFPVRRGAFAAEFARYEYGVL